MSVYTAYVVQLGTEVTFGTEVNASTILRGDKSFVNVADEIVEPDEGIGRALGSGRYHVLTRQGDMDVTDSPATVEQLPYFLQSIFGTVTATQDGVGDGYIRAYTVYDSGTFPTPVTYTVEFADEQQGYILTGGLVTSLTISGESGGAVMRSATIVGQNRGQTTITAGLSAPAITKLLFRNCDLFLDDVATDFGNTAATNWRSFELTIENLHEHKYDGDYATSPANGVYSNRTGPADGYSIELKFTLTHNAVAVAEYTDYLNKTPRAARIQMTGTAFTTGGTTYDNRTVIIDLPITYRTAPGPLTNDNGELVREFTGRVAYDSTLATSGTITVVNALSALP